MALPREKRVGAMADWLLGKSFKQITARWGVSAGSLHNWTIQMRDQFKPRRYRSPNGKGPRSWEHEKYKKNKKPQ